MQTIKLEIEGMNCQHCVKAVREELEKLKVTINKVEIGSAELIYNPDEISPQKIEEAVVEAGYKVKDIKNA